MTLTGEAFKSFKAYIKKENGWTNNDFNNHYNCQGYNKYTLADIIEWLDSVGIYVDAQPYVEIDETKRPPNILFFPNVVDLINMENSLVCDDSYPTRQQATEKAIERAVELFNEK